MARLVVVGGGLAGLVAALRAAEAGMSVTVLERGATEGGNGSARLSGGLLHVAWRPMDDPPDVLLRAIMSETDGEAGPALARALADSSREALEWFGLQGVDIRPKSAEVPYMKHAVHPHKPIGIGRRHMAERGPDQAVRLLYKAAAERGVAVVLSAVVNGLRRSGGGWTVGAEVLGEQRDFTADAVLLADGGFQNNPELLTRYVGPVADRAFLRASTASTGTGIRLALENGAGAVGLGRVYGHMVSSGAFENDMLWPYPPVDKLCLKGLIVDRRGRRVATRAENGVQLVNELIRHEDVRGLSVVFDDTLWETAGTDDPYGTPVPNPDLVDRGGPYLQADDPGGLAAASGWDGAELRASIAAHNEDTTTVKIAGRLHALRVVPGITLTMGGISTDEHARVLDPGGAPLRGLYAAGGCAGGIQGGPRGGYVGGLAVALVFGFRAGASIPADLDSAGSGAGHGGGDA
ncbi:FAD-dependent oxidoreductase [Streptomyces naphthomycinicus]|uniref:FAD-dependent oxidoreductase n=1 Tax=Streptomyces naphthomycinicus TaxID=2872625 RepID=UPI001CEDCA5B|nr:FAD-dependent oxidoreductase [Streptomyces sp. TML10]